MTYNIPTRYEEMILVVKIKTFNPCRVRIEAIDANQPNTKFTNRYKDVQGETIFYVRLPVTGNELLLDIYDDKKGNTDYDDNIEVVSITKQELDKKMDVIDFSNPYLKSFINFATRFCYNAGSIPTGTYVSDDNNFVIKYFPIIEDNGVEQTTPARIDIDNGIIEVSKRQFIDFTIPNRLAILLHEYSHVYMNDDVDDEVEADLNGLLIYLGLGYPRIEAFEVFAKTFINAPTQENKKRYDTIRNFIDDFEKQNRFIYN